MKKYSRISLTAALLVAALILPAAGDALDQVKFPYSPIAYHSLPWLVAKKQSSLRNVDWTSTPYSQPRRQ